MIEKKCRVEGKSGLLIGVRRSAKYISPTAKVAVEEPSRKEILLSVRNIAPLG